MKRHRHLLVLFILLALLPGQVHAEDPGPAKEYSSVEERRIDQAVMQERASLRKEREDIDLRKKELKSLEEGVDKKLTAMDRKLEELRKLQDKIESLLVAKAAEEKKRLQELAGIYQKMDPGKAAQVLSSLDQQLAADLLASMKVKAAANILNQITKQKATEISTTFSTLQIE